MIIKIFGSKNEGKTTIAEFLEQALSAYGIKVINEDEDKIDLDLEKRLSILGNAQGPMNCIIKTIPLKLETRPKYASDFDKNQ